MIISNEYCDKTYLIRLLQYYNCLSDYLILNYEIVGDNYDKTLKEYNLLPLTDLIKEVLINAPQTISYSVELVQIMKNKNKRKNITKTIRRAVYNRDKGVCQCCGRPLTLGTFDCTIDHIIANKYSHNNDMSNLQLLCRRCNLKKGSRIISNEDLLEEIINEEQKR